MGNYENNRKKEINDNSDKLKKVFSGSSNSLSNISIKSSYKEKLVRIDVKNVDNEKTITLQIKENITITELKRKIEKEFNLEKGFLNNIFLRLAINGERIGIILKNDNSKINQYRLGDKNLILFFKNKNSGGEIGTLAKSIADPTKKPPVEWPTIADGPFYLTVIKGINLFGICSNINCQAYKKEVCSQFGFGIFDLIKDLNMNSKKCPKCPVCETKLLQLESCGFLKCYYSYEGKKFEDGEIKNVDFKDIAKKDNKVYYIDPGKNGENKSKWIELKISASSL